MNIPPYHKEQIQHLLRRKDMPKLVDKKHTFTIMLDKLRTKARHTPVNRRQYTHIIGNNGLTLIDNNISILEDLTMLSSMTVPSIYFALTVCAASVSAIDKNNNTHAIIMKAQKAVNKSSKFYSFDRKVPNGYGKYYKILENNFELEDIIGCPTWKEARYIKDIIYNIVKLYFKLDGHTDKMK